MDVQMKKEEENIQKEEAWIEEEDSWKENNIDWKDWKDDDTGWKDDNSGWDDEESPPKEAPETNIQTEGLAFFQSEGVFYNPAMSTNRDLSVAALDCFAKMRKEEVESHNSLTFYKEISENFLLKKKKLNKGSIKIAKTRLSLLENKREEENADLMKELTNASKQKPKQFKGLKIFEALASSGLRSIRYLQEINPELIESVTINDIDPKAVEMIKENLALNCPNSTQTCVSQGDCVDMMKGRAMADQSLRFNCVDLDPYGSASPYLRSAIDVLEDEGLLCVTCTDMSVLHGNNKDTCFRKYGALSMHCALGHEFGLRIVLQTIVQECVALNCAMEPLLSMYCDYYMRFF
ncbi:hypothetical protein RFI_28623, partial [Reticulomyxa filosa]